MQGIYKIINKVNGKYYVGSTGDFERGWAARKRELRRGFHHNPPLQNAWNKYGEENFVFETMEEVEGNNAALLAHEQVYLDEGFELEILYNIARKAGGGNLGEDVNQKISAGVTKHNETHDGPFKGKHHTEETKSNLRESKKEWHRIHVHPMRGRRRTLEVLEQMAIGRKKHCEANGGGYWKGKKRSIETRQRMSKSHIGHETPSETRRKQSESQQGEKSWWWGKKHSEETCLKISRAMKGNTNHAKEYPAFCNAITRELIPAGRNLTQLCRGRRLNIRNMRNIELGKNQCTHDGWRLA